MKTMTVMAAISAALFCAAAAGAQDYSQRPTYGTVNLASGFTPDPYTRDLESGGPINAAERSGGECQGYIANAPDFRLNWRAGDGSLPLVFSVVSNTDTTLVVNGPDGRWYCDDDGGNNGLNPSLVFRRPASGQYDIWVGTYGRAALAGARLEISELYSQ